MDFRSPRQRTYTPIVDQHATCIAVNPIQGCFKGCKYCFLQQRNQTSVRPQQLVTPQAAVTELLASPFYAPDRPVELYTWTDVMDIAPSREHLAAMLSDLLDRGVRNPITLITKCHIPEDTLAAIVDARAGGLPVTVYLSYSGLGTDIERGIRHDQIAGNFPRLADAGVPIVHYWRPMFPAAATTENMTRVLDHAARYAHCTVAAGLKVEPAALTRLAKHWPELATTAGVTDAECVYPQAFWDFIHNTEATHPGYPLFHTNACALAYVLGRTDSFGIFGTSVCSLRNACPTPQRDRCAAAERVPPTINDVRAALTRRGLPHAPFTLTEDRREVLIHAPVDTNVAVALTQDLGVRVQVIREIADVYWSSGTAGAGPLVIA